MALDNVAAAVISILAEALVPRKKAGKHHAQRPPAERRARRAAEKIGYALGRWVAWAKNKMLRLIRGRR